ncbi:hypothetical protein DFH07DRAFT_774354 [Mycena maculata]|uniref:Alpha-type protein kinase domain-containing protein n=1 Tax=Mycena maculata TaxID=230809 RepID=A0AAD7NAP0_9AGAR|nr:hypothetical protein DFH07DRAFT_774354 [Mycena maculata]
MALINIAPCGGPNNVNEGYMEIFPRAAPGEICQRCQKIKKAVTPTAKQELKETLKSCEGYGLCGTTMKHSLCGTCGRLDSGEIDSELADFSISEVFMIQIQNDSEANDETDLADAYLVEPLRASSVVQKFTGTFGASQDTDKLTCTMLVFNHFIMADTVCSLAFANLQGSRHKGSLIIFDPMTHTIHGKSEPGDHGHKGIRHTGACSSLFHTHLDPSMVNTNGDNQYGKKAYLSDDILISTFKKYARANSGAGLNWKAQIGQLKHNSGLKIGKTKLYELRKELKIDTVKNSRQTRQIVVDIKQNDVAGGWGVTQTKGRMAAGDVLIPRMVPRDQLHQILHDEFPDEFDNRTAGLTTDMGKEVNEMHKIHEVLRDEVAPEFVPPQWPHGVKQSSTNNTPIKSFWCWLQDGEGHSVKMTLQQGAATRIFLPHDPLHRLAGSHSDAIHTSQTFYWLWVPLIQTGLDRYREYWNNHKLQGSKGKLNASGWSPYHMMNNPTDAVATARDCSIRVNPELVYRLREAYGGEEARDAAFHFVTREFEAEADAAYVDLGCPEIILPTGWAVFQKVVTELERRIGSIS